MSEKVISNDLTKKFNEDNKSSSEIDSILKDEIKKKYFEYIGVDENYRAENYDVNLVDVQDYGTIHDKNHIRVNLVDAGITWGLMVVAIIILYAVVSFLSPSLFLSIFMCLVALGILILILRAIVMYYDLIKSSRDIKFKLITSVYILPIVIALFYLFITGGIMGVLLVIVAFIIVAGLGALFLAIMK